ncbi:hypothetical protein MBUL_02686 [Methylobacterium bullatum]|uniref:Anti-sigma factor NepR domain-containing protein n=1 Tax=Methylobacterium bullatum TaxID=570505 RepID=A0A679JDC6_9HYPH|nr:hypothetical protein MBUL_02686 [Methylobacterium bullatum]
MSTAAAMTMANISRSGQSYTVYSESRMMQNVGDNLRTLYSEIIDHSVPEELLRLAKLIDDRCNAGAETR